MSIVTDASCDQPSSVRSGIEVRTPILQLRITSIASDALLDMPLLTELPGPRNSHSIENSEESTVWRKVAGFQRFTKNVNDKAGPKKPTAGLNRVLLNRCKCLDINKTILLLSGFLIWEPDFSFAQAARHYPGNRSRQVASTPHSMLQQGFCHVARNGQVRASWSFGSLSSSRCHPGSG